MAWVGQDWIGHAGATGHRLGPGLILHGQGDYLSVFVVKFCEVCFQLNQLVSTGASGLPPVENKDYTAFVPIILQRDDVAVGCRQTKFGRCNRI